MKPIKLLIALVVIVWGVQVMALEPPPHPETVRQHRLVNNCIQVAIDSHNTCSTYAQTQSHKVASEHLGQMEMSFEKQVQTLQILIGANKSILYVCENQYTNVDQACGHQEGQALANLAPQNIRANFRDTYVRAQSFKVELYNKIESLRTTINQAEQTLELLQSQHPHQANR